MPQVTRPRCAVSFQVSLERYTLTWRKGHPLSGLRNRGHLYNSAYPPSVKDHIMFFDQALFMLSYKSQIRKFTLDVSS